MKGIAPYMAIGKMKLKNFPRFEGLLKNLIYFKKVNKLKKICALFAIF